MKYLKLKAYSDGRVDILQNDLFFYTENESAELIVDYTDASVAGLRKWVDFQMADSTTATRPILAEFVTSDILIITLTAELIKEGPWLIQPFASDPLTEQRIVFELLKLRVNGAINALNDTAFVDPTLLEAALNGKVDKVIGKSLIDDTLITALTLPRWTDLNFPFAQTKVGSNLKPDFDYTNIGLLFPQNDPSEAVYLTVQMPHSWKEGTSINPHIHCVQKANQPVSFTMQYKWYNVGDQEPVAWTNHILNQYEVPYVSGSLSQIIQGAGMVDGIGKKISSILKIKLFRTDNTYTGDFFADQFDIHYQLDSFGSVQEYTK